MNVAQPLVQAGLIGEAIDTGPVLVLVADDELQLTAANRAACEALGYAREELLLLTVTDVAPGTAAGGGLAELTANGDGGGRLELLRKDGSPLEIEHRASRTTIAGMTFYVSVGFPV